MPLGWERINVKQTTPNQNIVFIKPRPGPDESTSKDFLERIAAQCLPIMNKHHLAVVSLEEYEPNLEFWGRNFNNGEVIQLVLKSPSTGRWLPLKFVQMVMLHELAHNKQMNHSTAFHAHRIEFTNEMKELWEKGYTGDGLWGRGILLENGAFAHAELGDGEVLPENLCGGTFKSRGGRKRKLKTKITYRDRQERRIKKKFGTNGVTLGSDEESKTKFEKGKKPAGKPRVAGSTRGRELRAGAALARFDTQKEESRVKDEELVTDSETESEPDDSVVFKTESEDAIDIDGRRLLDAQGLPLVKVCEDEDESDANTRNELLELRNFDGHDRHSHPLAAPPKSQPTALRPSKPTQRLTQSEKRLTGGLSKLEGSNSNENPGFIAEGNTSTTVEDDERDTQRAVKRRSSLVKGSCPICSVENESTALTCMICSNVLKPNYVANSWRCKSSTCKESDYVNAGDVNLCGVCGTRKYSGGISFVGS